MKEQQNLKTEKDNQSIANLIMVIAPSFFYFNSRFQRLALDPEVWTKLRLSRFRKISWVILLSVLVIITNLLLIRFLLALQFRSAIFTYLVNLLFQYPLAKLFLYYKLNQLVDANSKGKIDPSMSYKLRRTRIKHGAQYAELKYKAEQNESLTNCIGRRVEPHDVLLPIFGEPEINDDELNSVVNNQAAIFPLNVNSPDHHLVIGQTGSGKTTLITQMVSAALKNGWKVVILDLKGDPTDIDKFLSIEKDQSKVIQFPTVAFDFWKGTPNEIAERVISFIPSDSEPFYLNRNSSAIHAVVTRSGLPTPKSVDELVNRLRNGLRHSQTSSDIKFFSVKERGIDIGELIANDVATYLDPIRNIETSTPYRFHWNDPWKLSLFTLDGFEPSALRMADAILHDFASWIFSDERAANKSPILVIVDEASAFSALPRVPILSALMQRARSAKVSLVFASQNLSAFKDEKDNLLHSGAIRWLGSSTQVDEMVEAAGTRAVVESGFQFTDSFYSGVVTHRNQKEFKIDPDFVKELRTFHWFVSARGRVSCVYVPPLGFKLE